MLNRGPGMNSKLTIFVGLHLTIRSATLFVNKRFVQLCSSNEHDSKVSRFSIEPGQYGLLQDDLNINRLFSFFFFYYFLISCSSWLFCSAICVSCFLKGDHKDHDYGKYAATSGLLLIDGGFSYFSIRQSLYHLIPCDLANYSWHELYKCSNVS